MSYMRKFNNADAAPHRAITLNSGEVLDALDLAYDTVVFDRGVGYECSASSLDRDLCNKLLSSVIEDVRRHREKPPKSGSGKTKQ